MIWSFPSSSPIRILKLFRIFVWENAMDVVSSQGSSLLSVDLSGSDVTDTGLIHIKGCKNLEEVRGLLHLTALSLKRNNSITGRGISSLSGLINLLELDLERCPNIHGALVHLKGLTKLESLNVNCCSCIT